jgi:signal transduction histidine kinase
MSKIISMDLTEFLRDYPEISIILCDQRMPEKTGVQFFEEIRVEYPNPVRMLITGYTDIESVIDAVNRGHIFRYIKKPWTDSDIRSAIDEANKFFLTNALLVAKNKELTSAYAELGKFAYSITHDVRGPLLSIIGALDLAKGMDDWDELRELLGMMSEAVTKLDEYIKNTHEYYKLKRGQLLFSEINLDVLLADIAALFKIAGLNNNIQFTSKVIQSKPFYSDEISIKMILNNLLSNAFNYQRKNAREKSVDVVMEVVENDLIITVKDNGIGIHENHIKNIFEMFYRATSEETGSGLGLYNVKDALNRLEGTIQVQSEIDKGTTFTVTIPGKAHGAI